MDFSSAQLVSFHFISSHFIIRNVPQSFGVYISIESVKQANIKTNVPSHFQLDQMKQWIKKSAYEQIVDVFLSSSDHGYVWIGYFSFDIQTYEHIVVF